MRSFVSAITGLALIAGLVTIAPATAWSDDIADAKAAAAKAQAVSDKAKAESSQSQQVRQSVLKNIVTAKKDVVSAAHEVKESTAKLEDAQAKLQVAQAKLDSLQSRLRAAKKEQARIKAALEKAKLALQKAQEAESAAEQKVISQRMIIGQVTRSEFQKHTDLTRVSLLLDAEDSGDIADRLQWANTIFDNSAAQLQRLREQEAVLTLARQSSTEAKLALDAQNAAAKEQVKKVADLTDQAAAQAAQVQKLVAASKRAQATAEMDLQKSEKDVKALENQEKSIVAKIKAAQAKAKKYAAQAKAKAAQAAAKIKAREKEKATSGGESGREVKPGGTLPDGTPSPTTSPSAAGFIYPVNAKAGSPFGLRFHPILHYTRMHWGTDFGAGCGQPLYAMADGIVVDNIPSSSSHGLGNYTIISYGEYKGKSISSGYAHQSKYVVSEGQRVKQGQLVGYVGTTGLSTGCHLHLQIYYGGSRVNPMQFL